MSTTPTTPDASTNASTNKTPDSDHTAHLLNLMKLGDVAFNARDWAGMDAVHAPDMVAYIAGNPEPVRGRDAHAAAMRQFFTMFPDVHVDNDPFPIQFGQGDWITVISRTRGTFTGELALPNGHVIAATGRAFDLEFTQTVQWRENKIVAIHATWDTALQAQQIGLA